MLFKFLGIEDLLRSRDFVSKRSADVSVVLFQLEAVYFCARFHEVEQTALSVRDDFFGSVLI